LLMIIAVVVWVVALLLISFASIGQGGI
jgi:hypothetical protein